MEGLGSKCNATKVVLLQELLNSITARFLVTTHGLGACYALWSSDAPLLGRLHSLEASRADGRTFCSAEQGQLNVHMIQSLVSL